MDRHDYNVAKQWTGEMSSPVRVAKHPSGLLGQRRWRNLMRKTKPNWLRALELGCLVFTGVFCVTLLFLF